MSREPRAKPDAVILQEGQEDQRRTRRPRSGIGIGIDIGIEG